MDASEDFNKVFKEMLDSDICADQASLYVWSAFFFESKGRLHDAHTVYQLGISRSVIDLTVASIACLICHHKLCCNGFNYCLTV